MKNFTVAFILFVVFAIPLLAQTQSSTIRYANVASSMDRSESDSLSTSQVEALQWVAKGNAYHDNGMYLDALKCYRTADSLDSGNALVYYEIAYTYLALKNLDSTVFYAKKSVAIKPIEYAFSLVGDTYDYKDMLDSALKYYDLGLSFFPKSHKLLYNKGVTLFVHKHDDEALEVARRALSVTRRHEGSYFLTAQIAAKKSLWIDLFVDGTYANFIGSTKSRMDYVNKYFRELMLVFKKYSTNFNNTQRPLLDIHRDWAKSTVYRFVESESKFGKMDYDILDSLNGSENDYEMLVKLGVVAMREAVKLPYDFELKPFYKQIVDAGYENEYMHVVFRSVNQVAFDSWKMMNGKRLENFYDKIAIPFWDGEKKLKAPVLMDRPK